MECGRKCKVQSSLSSAILLAMHCCICISCLPKPYGCTACIPSEPMFCTPYLSTIHIHPLQSCSVRDAQTLQRSRHHLGKFVRPPRNGTVTASSCIHRARRCRHPAFHDLLFAGPALMPRKRHKQCIIESAGRRPAFGGLDFRSISRGASWVCGLSYLLTTFFPVYLIIRAEEDRVRVSRYLVVGPERRRRKNHPEATLRTSISPSLRARVGG